MLASHRGCVRPDRVASRVTPCTSPHNPGSACRSTHARGGSTMAKMTGGEALAQTLKAAGVEYIFGISVGSQAPLTLAAMRLGMRIVTVRDEKCAALMATAYSKISGKPGVCLASGPGAAHLALGMYEAFNASNAIVALTADASVAGMWRPGSTYMDQQA